MARPRFLILDEATSALDPESESLFMTNLARIAAGRTVIIVSHRLSTLVKCDKIVVLDAGQSLAEGTHADLVAGCPLYQHLWSQQNRNVEPGRA
jgi:ABC-type multidrug transport system fused ATPase/permease subunit